MSKRPSFQFYPSDWRKESGLRLCSIGARGLWIEMLMLMHEGEPYGHLTIQGRPIDPEMLARLIGVDTAPARKMLRELEFNGVFSRTPEGLIFSRRMVRDEDARERRAEGGKAGAEHGNKGGSHGSKGGRPPKEKTPLTDDVMGGLETPLGAEQKPPPSSSSSSASSEVSSEEAKASPAAGAATIEPDPPQGNLLKAESKTAIDIVKVIFDTGIAVLGSADIPNGQARSMLGKWKQIYGDPAVLSVLARCQVERPEQPIEWITKALQGEARRAAGQVNGQYPQPPRQTGRTLSERAAERLPEH